MKTELTSKLISRFDRLSGRRENWETHWQEVADYMLPRKADITKKRSRGDKRMERIFDSSPLQALELLSSPLLLPPPLDELLLPALDTSPVSSSSSV